MPTFIFNLIWVRIAIAPTQTSNHQYRQQAIDASHVANAS